MTLPGVALITALFVGPRGTQRVSLALLAHLLVTGEHGGGCGEGGAAAVIPPPSFPLAGALVRPTVVRRPVVVLVPAADLLEREAGLAGARADRADLLHGSGALRLPVEDLVLLEDNVTVESHVLGCSLEIYMKCVLPIFRLSDLLYMHVLYIRHIYVYIIKGMYQN